MVVADAADATGRASAQRPATGLEQHSLSMGTVGDWRLAVGDPRTRRRGVTGSVRRTSKSPPGLLKGVRCLLLAGSGVGKDLLMQITINGLTLSSDPVMSYAPPQLDDFHLEFGRVPSAAAYWT